jgi:hypothetical protein
VATNRHSSNVKGQVPMWLWSFVFLVAGALPGTFLVGPIVFADGPMRERLIGVAIAAVVYLLLGLLMGWLSRSKIGGVWLALPGVAVAFLLGEDLFLVLLVLAGVLPASILGVYLGARLRSNPAR